ncbi:uncharacterized protein BP5553_08689 [Venustampulla echinocandica]|uniref:Integral membrane protein n=1 Tax=Venustampulla echinocandica TaxID=2656787 RepID=A0A370TF18_9HELO|nr:uncharacterized protein BP5553_08689 [Venustampulla echinocandica]RDL33250.1 hypothetical protein BP5553_08689 [Venustampulla echinocandica]
MTSVADFKLASLAVGFTLGFGVLTVWTAIKQTRAVRSPLHSVYIFMVWGEIFANAAAMIVVWIFLEGYIKPGIPVYFGLLVLWSFEVQLLLQIIVNRIAIVVDDDRLVWKLKWGTALIITLVNIAVFCIWILAHSPPYHPMLVLLHGVLFQTNILSFVEINKYWDRCSKIIIMIVDAGLNYFFLRTVQKSLVKYHGLTKYAPLVSFNAKLMVVSVALDLMLVCLISLKNGLVYTQFHQVAYVVKLNIEMSMADLIRKLARKSIEVHNNEFIAGHSSTFNQTNNQSDYHRSHIQSMGAHNAIQMQAGVNASAVQSKMRGSEDGQHECAGIRTLKEVNVTVENVKTSDIVWRKSGSESGGDVEDGFQRKSSKGSGSEDELPLEPVPKAKFSEWKN